MSKKIDRRIPIQLASEVEEALLSRKPIVALESNIIAHGMQYPLNLEVAHKSETAIRAAGAVPATICIDDGLIKVGMNEQEIERFATVKNISKVSSRDVGMSLARREMGATTISSSIQIAELVGIPFFSSAGIGGVHRGAQSSMDISSDLIQFTRSQIVVVCAGAKSILDLQLTVEFLETHCIPVISYKSDYFPAFYCVSSGIRTTQRIDDDRIVAEAIQRHWSLGNANSVLITSPIAEADALDSNHLETALSDALCLATEEGVKGSGVTKYLMRAIEKATEGESVKANIAVVEQTASIAGHLALAYSAYMNGESCQ